MVEIEIRFTRAEDAAELKTKLREIWHDTYDAFWGRERVVQLSSQWHALEKLINEAESSDICSLVALSDGQIVGHALTYLSSASSVHIARLYLHKDFHGQGIGKRLLQQGLQAFPGAKSAHLEVIEGNERAVAFYRSQGFQVTERIRDEYVEHELYELKMQKVLLSNDQSG